MLTFHSMKNPILKEIYRAREKFLRECEQEHCTPGEKLEKIQGTIANGPIVTRETIAQYRAQRPQTPDSKRKSE